MDRYCILFRTTGDEGLSSFICAADSGTEAITILKKIRPNSTISIESIRNEGYNYPSSDDDTCPACNLCGLRFYNDVVDDDGEPILYCDNCWWRTAEPPYRDIKEK